MPRLTLSDLGFVLFAAAVMAVVGALVAARDLGDWLEDVMGGGSHDSEG